MAVRALGGSMRRRGLGQWPIFGLALAGLIGGSGLATSAAAGPVLPTGGVVQAGSASIGSSGSSLTVNQSSSRAIINWAGFSIGSGGSVQFNNGSGATLNRVTGFSASTIDGLLSGTGSVYLINPNGVIVGKSGKVDVGGTFAASTLDVSNAAFMGGGDLTFSGTSSAAVVNYGKIGSLGGDVALIAARVENDGEIDAAKGDVGLAAGYKVLLRDAALNDGKFAVLVGGLNTSATNTGVIQAADAELRANGGNVYALAGNTSSIIKATGVSSNDGKVFLIAEGGTTVAHGEIDATKADGTGGNVETSGTTVDFNGLTVKAGNWLIDPYDLTIDAAAATTISTNLATTSVTLQTTASSASGPGVVNANGSGDIAIISGISWSSGNTLTLDAYHSVAIDAVVSSTGAGGGVVIKTNDGGAGGGLSFGSGASLNFNNAGGQTLSINGSSYTLVYDQATLIADMNAAIASSHYALGNGFALSTTYTDLGAPVSSFAGTLEGLGHTLSGLTITQQAGTGAGNNIGLIGSLSGTVADLNLTSVSITDAYTGGPVNYIGGLAGFSSGTIRNVSVSGTVSGSTTSSFVGGVVGDAFGGSPYGVFNSSFSGGVTGHNYVGGLVGYANATLSGDWSSGTVGATGAGSSDVGGLAGYNGYQITQSYSSSTVTANNTSWVGGLVAYNAAGATVTDSYASGAVTADGSTDVGGFVGQNDGAISNAYSTGSVHAGSSGAGANFGAFAGTNSATGNIQYVYTTGAVTETAPGPVRLGDFAGLLTSGGIIDHAVYDKTTATGWGALGSGTVPSGLVGETTTQMQDSANYGTNFGGWDFTNTWAPPSAGHFPELYGVSNVLKLTAQATSMVYGDTPPTTGPLQTLGLQGNDVTAALTGVTFSTTALATSNVGAYTITPTSTSVTGASGRIYRVVSDVAGTLTVDPRALTVSLIGTVDKTYDGTTSTAGSTISSSNFSIANIANSDPVKIISFVADYASMEVLANTGTGVVTADNLILGGAGAGNYYLVSTGPISGNVGQIDARVLTPTLPTTIAKTFDNTATATLGSNYALANIIPADSSNVTLLAGAGFYSDKHAALAKLVTFTGLTLTGSKSSDYVLSTTSVSFGVGRIDQKSLLLALTGSTIDKTYDGTTVAPFGASDYTLTGVIGGNVVTLSATATYDNKNVAGSPTKLVTFASLGLGGADGADYKLDVSTPSTLSEATGQIDPKPLTLALTGLVQKTYDGNKDGTLSSANYLATGVVLGDSVTFTGPTGLVSNVYDSATAGTGKLITVTGLSISGADAANYTIASYLNTLSGNIGVISAAGLSVVVGGFAEKTYDGNTTVTDPLDLTYTLTGAPAGVSVNAGSATPTYNNANAGTGKLVTITGLTLTGANASNYTISSIATGTVGIIDPKSITAVLTGTVSKVYDGTTKATLGTYTLNGLIVADAGLVGMGATSGAYDTKDVTGSPTKTVSFQVYLNGPKGSNYKIDPAGYTLLGTTSSTTAGITTLSAAIGTITPRPITASLIGTIEKTYDGTTTAVLGKNYSFSNVVASDLTTLSLTADVGNYDNQHVGTGKLVTFSGFHLTGASAIDYSFTPITLSGNVGKIDPKTLTASVTGTIQKTYDGTTTALLGSNYSLSGVVLGDTVTLAAATGAYDTKNAGLNKQVRFNGLTLGGPFPGDYKLSSTSMVGLTNGKIDPKSVSLSLIGPVEKTYDGTTTATLKASNYTIVGMIAGDGVTAIPTTGTYTAGKHVGSNLNVSFTGIHLTGLNASNYLLGSSTLSGAVGKIDPKAITVTLVGTVTKLYDGNTNALIQPANYYVVGFIPGDTVALNKPTHGTYNNAARGTGKMVTVTGLALTGTSAGDYTLASSTVAAPIGTIK
jgi:filamentous hemagglutinin family protein